GEIAGVLSFDWSVSVKLAPLELPCAFPSDFVRATAASDLFMAHSLFPSNLVFSAESVRCCSSIRLDGLLCRCQLWSTSPAPTYKPPQRFVLFLGELLQRTFTGFLHYSLGDGLLQFGRNLGIPEGLHQAC